MFFKKPGEPFLKTACLCHLFLCMFSYFSIFLNLYHIIQAKNKEMSDGSKHLHSTVKTYMCFVFTALRFLWVFQLPLRDSVRKSYSPAIWFWGPSGKES